MGQRVDDGQFDLVRAKEGGLDAMFFSLFVTEQYYPARMETKQVLRLIDAAADQLARNRDKIELALDASDVERISRSGKIAAFMDLEGGFDLDGDLAVLRTLYRLGLRSFQLPAHNWANNFADSCCAPAKWHGLNDRGRAVVHEANRLGMVINISHGSDETIAQAIDVSADPILATHHGLRSFNDIPRTMPDDLLRKLAAKGGVIGFQIGNEFHNVKVFNWRTEHAGKPFWDTTDIGRKEAAMSIEELDALAAPQFPMVGVAAPEDDQVHPVRMARRRRSRDRAGGRGSRHARVGLRRRPDAAARDAGRSRPADADRGDAEAGMVRTADQEVPGRQPAPRGPPGDGEEREVR